MLKTIPELRDVLNHKVQSAADITDRADKENRQLTPAEDKLIKDLLAEGETIRAEIKAIEDQDKTRQAVKNALENLKTAGPRTVPGATPTSEPVAAARPVVTGGYRRTGNLKAFKGADGEYNAYKSGQFFLAAVYGNYKAQRWCSENGMDLRNALSEGVNTAGGFIVPEEMSQAIIDLREEYGVFRKYANYLPLRGETITIPRISSRGTASFTDEGGSLTLSDIELQQVRLTVKKLGRAIYFSSELDEDAVVNLGDLVADKFAYSFALKEDQCGFIGDASATYGGITGLTTALESATYAGSAQDATSGHDQFSEIDNTDISLLMSKLPQYARMRAKFYCSQVAHDLVFQRLALAAGGNTIQTLSGKFAPSYAGYEIVISQVLPTSTSALNNSAMILFGDLSMSSTLAEKRGFTLGRSTEARWLQDQVAVKATERIDIVNHDLGDTTTAGSMVALLGNT